MVTVHREFGFRVVIYPSGREHGPPHVHVFNADGEARQETFLARWREHHGT